MNNSAMIFFFTLIHFLYEIGGAMQNLTKTHGKKGVYLPADIPTNRYGVGWAAPA